MGHRHEAHEVLVRDIACSKSVGVCAREYVCVCVCVASVQQIYMEIRQICSIPFLSFLSRFLSLSRPHIDPQYTPLIHPVVANIPRVHSYGMNNFALW